MPEETTKVFEEGNFDLETAVFTGNARKYQYGATKKWHGTMSLTMDFTQEVTSIAADDDPDYLQIAGFLTGSGSLKIAGMKLDEYQELFNVDTYSESGPYLFGSKKIPKEVGLAFKNTSKTESGQSFNKFVLYRVKATLPPLTTESMKNDGVTIRDFTINITASSVYYRKADGTIDAATYGAYNSEKHSSVWSTIASGIKAPNGTTSEDIDGSSAT